MRPRAITLLSGGLDSSIATLLAREACDIVLALTFDYGQRAYVRERESARTLCKDLNIAHRLIELPWLAELTDTALVNRDASVPEAHEDDLDERSSAQARADSVWVPNRNGLFANIAACYADAVGADEIIMGLNAEEARTFPDNTETFAEHMTQSFSLSTRVHPRVISPTVGMTKVEIAQHAVRLGFTSFWCCYHGGEKLCGKCESCVRSMRAFRAAGSFGLIADRFYEG